MAVAWVCLRGGEGVQVGRGGCVEVGRGLSGLAEVVEWRVVVGGGWVCVCEEAFKVLLAG